MNTRYYNEEKTEFRIGIRSAAFGIPSGQDLLHHIAVHVRESEVAALLALPVPPTGDKEKLREAMGDTALAGT